MSMHSASPITSAAPVTTAPDAVRLADFGRTICRHSAWMLAWGCNITAGESIRMSVRMKHAMQLVASISGTPQSPAIDTYRVRSAISETLVAIDILQFSCGRQILVRRWTRAIRRYSVTQPRATRPLQNTACMYLISNGTQVRRLTGPAAGFALQWSLQ